MNIKGLIIDICAPLWNAPPFVTLTTQVICFAHLEIVQEEFYEWFLLIQVFLH